MGLIPTIFARVFATLSRISGMARIGPMLKIGLLGHRMMRSVFSIAGITPGAGVARAAPSYVTSSTLAWNFLLTKYSWNSSTPRGALILVATIWSVIGRILTLTPQELLIFSVTSDRLKPSWRSAVRT